jgi:hypothetical protein
LELLIGICFIELDNFDSARIELAKASDLGKEEEVDPWISYMDSTESLRAAST